MKTSLYLALKPHSGDSEYTLYALPTSNDDHCRFVEIPAKDITMHDDVSEIRLDDDATYTTYDIKRKNAEFVASVTEGGYIIKGLYVKFFGHDVLDKKRIEKVKCDKRENKYFKDDESSCIHHTSDALTCYSYANEVEMCEDERTHEHFYAVADADFVKDPGIGALYVAVNEWCRKTLDAKGQLEELVYKIDPIVFYKYGIIKERKGKKIFVPLFEKSGAEILA